MRNEQSDYALDYAHGHPNGLHAGPEVLYSRRLKACSRAGCTLSRQLAVGVRYTEWKRGYSRIFRDLITDHLKRFTYREIAVNAEKRMTALRPAFLRSSCSGSAAQFRNVTTSLAIWEVVAGVPGGNNVR